LKELKTINLENNQIPPGALGPIANLPNLQNLQLSGNILGKPTPELAAKLKAAQNDPTHPPLTLPELPTGLKQVTLASNHLSHIPRAVMTNHLTKLVKLDLSNNSLAAIPTEIVKLKNLTEIVADDNAITSLPKAIGLLTDLKVLSLKNNKISAGTYPYSEKNPQPLPASLFTDTKVIDLNLHGNPLTNTELNRMEGFEKFLERRQAVKTTTLLGGGLTSMTTCGLE
jgi:Leucine-rich repeat (LRR) protein